MMELLNGKELMAYLGIKADTLRRIRQKDPTFPGFFTRKLYSKPEIDNWLRSRIPENNSQNINFDISAEVNNTLSELFSTTSRGLQQGKTPPGRVPAKASA